MENNLLFKLLLILKLQFFSEARQLTLELHSNAEEKVLLGQSLFEVALQFVPLRFDKIFIL